MRHINDCQQMGQPEIIQECLQIPSPALILYLRHKAAWDLGTLHHGLHAEDMLGIAK